MCILEAKVSRQIFSSMDNVIDLLSVVDSPKIISKLYNVVLIIFAEEPKPRVEYFLNKIPKLAFSIRNSFNHLNLFRKGKNWTLSTLLFDIEGVQNLKYFVNPNFQSDNFHLYFNSKAFGLSYNEKTNENSLNNNLSEILEIDLQKLDKTLPSISSAFSFLNQAFPANEFPKEPSPVCSSLAIRLDYFRNFNCLSYRAEIIICAFRALDIFNLMLEVGGDKISQTISSLISVAPDYPIIIDEIIEILYIPAPIQIHVQIIKCISDFIIIDRSDTRQFLMENQEFSSSIDIMLFLISKIKFENLNSSLQIPEEVHCRISSTVLKNNRFILEILTLIKKFVKSVFIDDEGNSEAGTLFLLIRISQSFLQILDNPVQQSIDENGRTVFIKPYSSEIYVCICEIMVNMFTNHYISSELDFIGNFIRFAEKELIMLTSSSEIFEISHNAECQNIVQKIPEESLFEYLAELLNIIDSPFYRRVPARAQLVPTMARKISESKILELVQPFFFEKIRITEKLFVYTMILAGDICREITSAVDDLIDKKLFQAILKRLFFVEYPSDSESYPMIAYLINMLGLSEKGRDLELEWNAIGRFFEIFVDPEKFDLLYGESPYPHLKTVSSLAHEFYEMSTTVDLLKDRMLSEIRNTFENMISQHVNFKKRLSGFAKGNLPQVEKREFELLAKQQTAFLRFFSKMFMPYSALSEKFKENGCIDYLFYMLKLPTVILPDVLTESWNLLISVKQVAYEGKYSRLSLWKKAENDAIEFSSKFLKKNPEYFSIDFFEFSFEKMNLTKGEFFPSDLQDPKFFKFFKFQTFNLSFFYLLNFIIFDSNSNEQGKKTVGLLNIFLHNLRILTCQVFENKQKGNFLLEKMIQHFKKFLKTAISGIALHSFMTFSECIPRFIKLFEPHKNDLFTSLAFTQSFFQCSKDLISLIPKNPLLMILFNSCGFFEVLFAHIKNVFSNEISIEELQKMEKASDYEKGISSLKKICTIAIGQHLNSPIYCDLLRTIHIKILNLGNVIFQNLLTKDKQVSDLSDCLCTFLIEYLAKEEKAKKEIPPSTFPKIFKKMGFSQEIIDKAIKFHLSNSVSLFEIFETIINRKYENVSEKENDIQISHFSSKFEFDLKKSMSIEEYNASKMELAYNLGESLFKRILCFKTKGRKSVKRFLILVLEKFSNESKKTLSNAIIYTIIGSLKNLLEEMFPETNYKFRLFFVQKKKLKNKLDIKQAFFGIEKDKMISLKDILAIFITFFEFTEIFEPKSIKGNCFLEFLKLGKQILTLPIDKNSATQITFILFLCQRYLNKSKNENDSKSIVMFLYAIFVKCKGENYEIVKKLFNASTRLLVSLFKTFPLTIEYFVGELRGLQFFLSLEIPNSEKAFPALIDRLLRGEKIAEIALKSEISMFFYKIENCENNKEKKRQKLRIKGNKRMKERLSESSLEIEKPSKKEIEERKIDDFISHFSFYCNSENFLETVKSLCELKDDKIILKAEPVSLKFPLITETILSFLINTLEKKISSSENEDSGKMEIEGESFEPKNELSFSKQLLKLNVTNRMKEMIAQSFHFTLSQHPELFTSFSKLKSRKGNYLFQIALKNAEKGEISTSSCSQLLRKFCKDSFAENVVDFIVESLKNSDEQKGFYNVSCLLTSILDLSNVASYISNTHKKLLIEIYTESISQFIPETGKYYDDRIYKVSNPLSIIMQYLVYFTKKRENLPKMMPKDVLFNSENIVENWNITMGYQRPQNNSENFEFFISDEDLDLEDFPDTLEQSSNAEEEILEAENEPEVSFEGSSDEQDNDASLESSNFNNSNESSDSEENSSDDENVRIADFDSIREISEEFQVNIPEVQIQPEESEHSSSENRSLISSTIPLNIQLTVDNFGNNNSRESDVYTRMVNDVLARQENEQMMFQIDEFPEADPMEILEESENSKSMFHEIPIPETFHTEDFKERLIGFLTDKPKENENDEEESIDGQSDLPLNLEEEQIQPQNASQEPISSSLRATLDQLGLDESFIRLNQLDISFLNNMTPEIQNEILGSLIEEGGDDEPLEEFMNALDPRVRRQIENQNQIIVHSNQPLNNLTFINALPEAIRREILESANSEFLDTLPDSFLSQYGKKKEEKDEKEEEILRSELIPDSEELVDWLLKLLYCSNYSFTRFPFGLLKALLKNEHNYQCFMRKTFKLLQKLIREEKFAQIIFEKEGIIANFDCVRNLVSIKILTFYEHICKEDLSFFYQEDCRILNEFLSLVQEEFVKRNTGHLIIILIISNFALKNFNNISKFKIDNSLLLSLLDILNTLAGPDDPILLELASLFSKISLNGEIFDALLDQFLLMANFFAKELTNEIKSLNVFEKNIDRQFNILFKTLSQFFSEKTELAFKLNDFLEKGSLKVLWETLKAIFSSYKGKESISDRFVQRFIGILENYFLLNKLLSNQSEQNEKENTLRINFSPEHKSLVTNTNSIFSEICEQNQKIINMMVRHNLNILSDALSVIIEKMPRILTFENKRLYFKSEIRKLKKKEGVSPFRIRVRRSEVFLDSFHQMRAMSPKELKGNMSVEFSGEEGIDEGGVTREWFILLSREIFNPNYVLFKPSANNVTYIPSENSSINAEEHLAYFKFIGRIIAKAIHDGFLLDCFFAQFFYKHILGQQLSVRDMEDFDPEFYKNLLWILENNIEGLDMTFSYERNEFGNIVICDMIENGRNILVDESNKSEYILKMCEAKMIKDIEKQIQAFLEGFYDIIPKELIRIFDFRELELMISGLPDIDIQDLKNNSEYTNYNPQSESIIWLWEILEEFGKEDRASFIQFVTGTSKVPLEGFKMLRGANGLQKFQVHKCFDSTKLPTSHTCFNQLDLPVYETKEILQQKLLLAIREGREGFGFA